MVLYAFGWTEAYPDLLWESRARCAMKQYEKIKFGRDDLFDVLFWIGWVWMRTPLRFCHTSPRVLLSVWMDGTTSLGCSGVCVRIEQSSNIKKSKNRNHGCKCSYELCILMMVLEGVEIYSPPNKDTPEHMLLYADCRSSWPMAPAQTCTWSVSWKTQGKS